jgi:hypothetical protein
MIAAANRVAGISGKGAGYQMRHKRSRHSWKQPKTEYPKENSKMK